MGVFASGLIAVSVVVMAGQFREYFAFKRR